MKPIYQSRHGGSPSIMYYHSKPKDPFVIKELKYKYDRFLPMLYRCRKDALKYGRFVEVTIDFILN